MASRDIKLRIVDTKETMVVPGEVVVVMHLQANLTYSPNQFVGVIKTYMVSNALDWWFDTGATRHICNSRSRFARYQKVDDGEPMFMGNASTAKIEGKWKVILKLTSGKDLMLMDVLHVPL